MTGPDVAALLLLDPTFSLMTPAERRLEAVELMRFNGLEPDELEAAVYAEEAEERHARGDFPAPEAPAPLPAGLEPCRENRALCASPVAANGRCMDCGARRAAEPTPEAALDLSAPEPAPAATGDTLKAPPPGFLARFKGSTGNNDRQIGDLLGLARSSVQAIIGGRVGETLTPAHLEKLDAAIAGQQAALAQLRAEIRQDARTDHRS